MAAFEAIGGVPKEILYDRMKTAVIGGGGGSIVYNRALIDFARHYGFQPKACRPYRAKTKGKVERPYRYTACVSTPISCQKTFAPKRSSTPQSRHRHRGVAGDRRKMEHPITQPADHHPAGGEFYFGIFGDF